MYYESSNRTRIFPEHYKFEWTYLNFAKRSGSASNSCLMCTFEADLKCSWRDFHCFDSTIDTMLKVKQNSFFFFKLTQKLIQASIYPGNDLAFSSPGLQFALAGFFFFSVKTGRGWGRGGEGLKGRWKTR